MAERSTTLEIIDENGISRRMEVSVPRLVVGRMPELDVCLAAEGVSRRHAELLRNPGGHWWLRDLGSRNGTRVNGQNVTETVLSGGERIRIGPYVLRLWIGGAEGASPLMTIAGQVPISDGEPGAVRSLAEMPAPEVQADHLSRLAQFGRDLGEMEDPSTRLQMLCALMTSGGFPGQCAAALRMAGGSGAVEPQMLLPPVHGMAGRSSGMPYLSGSVLAAVRQRGRAVLASNTSSRGAARNDVEISMAASVQIHAAIACPIGSGNQTLDVLYVVLAPSGATAQWLAIASLAAEQYQQSEFLWAQRRVAAEHAVVQQELEQARKVQDRLVPRKIAIEGIDFAVEFHPCRWVAGDYVDVIRVAPGRIVLVVADVCGHGMQAALLASTLHAVLNVLVPAGMELAKVLEHLNDYLCQTLSPAMFVTALFVELDVKSGRSRAVRAGHPPPVLVDSAGGWRELRCGQFLPLGVETAAKSGLDISLESDELPAGHVLALYTDGLFEVKGEDGEQLGCAGLAEKLASICAGKRAGSEGIARGFVEFIEQLQDGRLATDDQSLMVVRRVL